VEEKAAINYKLEAFYQKRQRAAASHIQARFRGYKDRVLGKGRLAALVDLKVAKEKEKELRKEQARMQKQQKQREDARVLEQQKRLEKESQLAQTRAEEKALIKRKLEAGQKQQTAAARCIQARFPWLERQAGG